MSHIIITGASRGIGKATTLAFLEEKKHAVIGSSISGIVAIKETNFEALTLNLEDSKSINQFVETIKEKKIELVGLINNAGILLEDWKESKINLEQLKQTFAVNVFGTIELTEKLLPLFQPQAHIINISSGWGTFSEEWFDEFQPHYKLSKAALNMYTKLLAKRLESQSITVSALDPGWVQTDMGTAAASKTPLAAAKEIVELFEQEIPSGYFWANGKQRAW